MNSRTTLARQLRSWCRITAETLSVFKQSNRTLASTDFSGTQYRMTAQKEQKKPSFPLIFSVLSIVFYCAGFLRVELDLNEQKKRIQALESIEETKSHINILDLVTKSKEITPGMFLTKLLKKRRLDVSKQHTQPPSTKQTRQFGLLLF